MTIDNRNQSVSISLAEFEKLQRLATTVYGLQDKLNRLELAAESKSPTPAKEPRLSDPDFFNGNRSHTSTYLTQVKMVISGNPSRFPTEKSKILYAASYLRGAAFSWIQPHLDSITSPLILSFENFAQGITNQFGQKDDKSTAERDIYSLRQTGSVSSYATDFTRISSRLSWNDAAYMSQFYRNLKPAIKDEMMTFDKPVNLEALISLALRIDNRLYERKVERQSESRFYDPTPRTHDTYDNTNYSDDSNYHPMEIGALKTAYRGKVSFEERERRRNQNLCAYCGSSDHVIDKCSKRPQKMDLNSRARRN